MALEWKEIMLDEVIERAKEAGIDLVLDSEDEGDEDSDDADSVAHEG